MVTLDKFGGRKFALVVLVFITTLILTATKHVDLESFQNVVQLVVLVYLSGNVVQSLVTHSLTMESESQVQETVTPGRKFALVLMIFVSVTAMLVLDYCDSKTFTMTSYWIVGGYASGNVVQKLLTNGITVAGKSFPIR